MFLFPFLSFFVDGIVFKVFRFMRESEQLLSLIYEFCVRLKLFEKSNYNCFVCLSAQVMAVYTVNFSSLFECGAQLE